MKFRIVNVGQVGSTQVEMRARMGAGEDVTGLCLRAEAQLAGKGRRGTTWSSPPGGSYQSVGLGRQAWPWLTLALGVGIAGELGALPGAPRVFVKWPNDLYLAETKLGGILTEVVSGQVIAGVGVNVTNPVGEGAARLEGQSVDAVSEAVLTGLANGLELAAAGGPAIQQSFEAVDFLAGRTVDVTLGDPAEPHGSVTGVARGVSVTGGLVVAVSGTEEPIVIQTGHITRFGKIT